MGKKKKKKRANKEYHQNLQANQTSTEMVHGHALGLMFERSASQMNQNSIQGLATTAKETAKLLELKKSIKRNKLLEGDFKFSSKYDQLIIELNKLRK
ncbi:MAG: hypothetical protein AAF193_06950 [Bacteroidota bacterium]